MLRVSNFGIYKFRWKFDTYFYFNYITIDVVMNRLHSHITFCKTQNHKIWFCKHHKSSTFLEFFTAWIESLEGFKIPMFIKNDWTTEFHTIFSSRHQIRLIVYIEICRSFESNSNSTVLFQRLHFSYEQYSSVSGHFHADISHLAPIGKIPKGIEV